MGDRKKLLDELNEAIRNKEAEKAEKRNSKPRRPKPTRSNVSRANGSRSHGPVTPLGKQRASANSLKHGFYAHIEKLNPRDAPIYQRLLQDLRLGLLPDGAVEELMVRELAMLNARLQRLEAAEYALLCSQIEAPPEPAKPKSPAECDDLLLTEQEQQIDSRQIAAAFLNTQDDLDRLYKTEVHLRRAYNRTWDRLTRLQKERRKLTPQEMTKRTHHWISEQQERRKPDLDPNGFLPSPPDNATLPRHPNHYPPPHPDSLSDPHRDPPQKEPQSA